MLSLARILALLLSLALLPAASAPAAEAGSPPKAAKTARSTHQAAKPGKPAKSVKQAKARKARPVAARPQSPGYASRAEAQAFADELAQKHAIDRQWLRRTVGQARQLAVVARLVLPPPVTQPKNWAAYRERFLDPVRIEGGVKFWQAHRATLARAEKEFGVPAAIIVGIIGVETLYGRHMGNFRVLDALATLAFDFPAEHPRAAERSRYFRGELEQFLVSQHQARTDPLEARGSYAGAMGIPQFMPTSVARWGMDYDGDRLVDLRGSVQDAIGSVANYFRSFGWKPGQPIWYPVSFERERLDLDTLLAPDILPTFSAAAMQARGVVLDGAAREHAGPLALVELQNGGEPPSYVAGTENFYVITRYNWSSYYAMAVAELGREIQAELARREAAPATGAP